MCFSHKNKLLLDHLNNVYKIGKNIHENLNVNFGIDSQKINLLLKNVLFLHDFGKATSYFQDYLQASIENNTYNEDVKLTRHSLISASYASYKTFIETKDLLLSLICFIVILKHHGDLENLEDLCFISNEQINLIQQQYNSICWSEIKLECYDSKEIINFIKNFWKYLDKIPKDCVYNFFLVKYIYSILVYSDKNEVVFGKGFDDIDLPQNVYTFIPNYKNKKFNKSQHNNPLDKLRETFYQHSINNIDTIKDNVNIIFVNVPTGLGKTLTGLQIAINLKKKNTSLKRIIYAVPFTSIIDQIEEIITEVFSINNEEASKYFIKHHHLTEPNVRIDEDWISGEKGQFFIENWDTPLILTTFWQMFNTIFSGDNKLNRKFHNFANSIIILDEIQTLPLKYWKLVRDVLSLLTEKMNCKIIYMTATIPIIFNENSPNSLTLKLMTEDLEKLNRYEINILNSLSEITETELFNHIQNELQLDENKNKNFLFVTNTIKESLILYEKIKEFKKENDLLFYLSTNIIPKDRKRIIKDIKQELRSDKRILLVSTQLIEAGVDLDFDIVYRDLAPLDSIVQTAGRCNRNNKGKGKVFLFNLKDEEKNGGFYSFIYEDISINPTKKILKNINKIDENGIFNILNDYFSEVQNKMSDNLFKEIYENLKELNFKEVKNNFVLIEDVPNIPIFVEKDEKATDILNSYKQIKESFDGYEFKAEFLKIKKDFYDYVLSKRINNNQLQNLNILDSYSGFYIISKDCLNDFYDEDKGFLINPENSFF